MFIDTELRPQGEVQQQVGKLKLSEAIRIGARMRPQCHNGLLSDGEATCALGAAAMARGWNGNMFDEVREKFLSEIPDPLWGAIGFRNDRGESRESIADWLESQGL